MTEGLLRSRLEPVASRRAQLRFFKRLAVGWCAAAAFAAVVFLAQRLAGWASPLTIPIVAAIGFVLALVFAFAGARRSDSLREAAEEVERHYPELDGLLLTAVQQRAAPDAPLGYLQRCLLRDAVAHSRRHDWPQVIPGSRLARVHFAHLAALVLFFVALVSLRPPGRLFHSPLLVQTGGVQVTPGDIELERGQNLVVLARFNDSTPARAELVIGSTPETERRVSLTRSLSDPVFGGTYPEVTDDFVYRVEYDGKRTREFKVSVFEHPRLERSDAELTYPEYTRLPARRIEDTRRVTAVEGTRVDLSLQFNKPLASATLAARDRGMESLRLEVSTNQPSARLAGFPLLQRGAYDLVLVDADGRSNKVPAQFVFEALPNRTPELKLASPRGDIRPSALEEVQFDGTVWDDFGVLAHGIGYSLVGEDTRLIELGRDLPASKHHPFNHVIRLEDLGVRPDQLVSWYVWADDIGPDGNVRRTTGDLLFAEIRPFDEIFREGSGGGEQQQGQSQSGEQQGNPTQELVRLQKQIVSATWKLQRDSRSVTEPYKEDVEVVRQSQAHVIDLAEAAAEETQDRQMRAIWDSVLENMGKALVRLADAADSLSELNPALAAEQAAYQGLLKLQARETEVTRSRGGGGGGGGGNQRQLNELELSQSENRYETQREAQSPTSPERREQLQVLSRLQELARRQNDLNERLRELQTALQEAATEREREEIRRQLKRLEEQQQEMLADLDELEQRTQRPENQSRMSELREELQQTREDLQRAAEAARQGEVSQALAAGTRAQRQLESLRDEARQQNASAFAEDLRQMRADARELERRQQEILDALQNRETARRPALDAPDTSQETLQKVEEQKERLADLMDRATQVSQAAEASEPLVAGHLYDMLRQLSQDESLALQKLQEDLIEQGRMTSSLYENLRQMAESERAKSLEAAAEMLRNGLANDALRANERAQANIETLRRGVDRAAQSVLGNDTAALQLARDELDALTEQLQREIDQATGRGGGANQAAQAAAGGRQPGERNADGSQPGEEGSRQLASAGDRGQTPGGERPGEGEGQDSQQPGQSGQGQQGQQGQGEGQAQASAQGQGQSPGQEGQDGQGQGQGQAQAQAQGQGQQGQGQGQGGEAGQNPQLAQSDANSPGQAGGQQAGGDQRGGQRGGANRGGRGGPGGFDLNELLGFGGGGPEVGGGGPLTTDAFAEWSDRLREVEQLIDLPELQADVARARERARLERSEARRALKKPDWAVVELEILGPLVEVRRELDAELARRTAEDPLLPVDRDPVPTRFTELVRRYYEALGSGAPRPAGE